jgi:DNA-binding winged helix-turn-helix (wHTH) protein/tetratricopeptide (TPR) repeat protein
MAGSIYVFGDCRLNTARRELWRGGALVEMSPKVFDCLAYLVAHHERAVGRDELVAAVWGATEATDMQVAQAVLRARRAIGDTGDEQQWIKTIPRFGYRCSADVRVEEVRAAAAAVSPRDGASAPPAVPPAVSSVPEIIAAAEAGATPALEESPHAVPEEGPSTPAPSRAPRWLWPALLSAAALLLVASVFVTWRLTRPGDTAPPPMTAGNTVAPIDAVAVMPVDVSAGDEWTWARLGAMDAIAGRLRGSGQTVLASSNIVALTRALPADADEKTLVSTLGARQVVHANATLGTNGWIVRLTLYEPAGERRFAEARGADVITTSRAAADRLMVAMGRSPPAPESAQAVDKNELLQRIDLAITTDDLDGARKLFNGAPESIRQTPEARLILVRLKRRAGQFVEAERDVQSLLTEVKAESDPVLRGRILNVAGANAVHDRRYDDAGKLYEESIGLLKDRNDASALGSAYTGHGTTFAFRGRFDDALKDYSRARVAYELAGDQLSLARVEANEGELDMHLGRYADALPLYDRAEDRFVRFGAHKELITMFANHTEVHLGLLQASRALAESDRGLPLLKLIEDKDSRHEFATSRASALAANGHLAEARALLRETERDINPDNERFTLSATQLIGAHLDLVEGNYSGAATLARAAVADFIDADQTRERAQAWLIESRALRGSGSAFEAEQEAGRFAQWAAAVRDPVVQIYAALAKAEQAWSAQRRDEGRAAWENALRLVDANPVPQDVAEVVVSYATALIAAGELEHAVTVVGRVSRWSDEDFDCAVLHARLYRALGRHDAWQSALERARRLAGERVIPADVRAEPVRPS